MQAVKSSTGKDLTKEEWQAVDKSSVQELRLHVVFGGSAVSAASSMVAAPVAIAKDATPEQVRAKYDELVTLFAQVEKEKKRLESELDSCKLQIKKKPLAAEMKGGFSTIQLIVAMLLAVIIARFATVMGY